MVNPFPRILIATDGTTTGDAAVKTGLDLALELDSAVTVLHVAADRKAHEKRLSLEWQQKHPEALKDLVELGLARGKDILERARTEANHRDMEIETMLKQRDPRDLPKMFDEDRFDLVVVARQGGKTFRPGLGRTGRKILLQSKLPVLVVGGEKELDLERILVVTNFSPTSRVAVEVGAVLGDQIEVVPKIFHVYSISGHVRARIGEREAIRIATSRKQIAQEEMAEIKEWSNLRGLKLETEIVNGDPAERILAEAEKHDLVILSTGAPGKKRLLEHISMSLPRLCSTPVLIVPSPAAQKAA